MSSCAAMLGSVFESITHSDSPQFTLVFQLVIIAPDIVRFYNLKERLISAFSF